MPLTLLLMPQPPEEMMITLVLQCVGCLEGFWSQFGFSNCMTLDASFKALFLHRVLFEK